MKTFKVGQHNIYYIWPKFEEHFGSMKVSSPKNPHLEFHKLERSMNNKEILAEFKPQEATLGELLYAIKNPKKVGMLENGYANIFYIRDAKNNLWAVDAYFDAGDGWSVSAYSVDFPNPWDDENQVLSRKFGGLGPLASGSLDGKILELDGGEV